MLVLVILARGSNSDISAKPVTLHQPLIGWAVAPSSFALVLRSLLARRALPADVGHIVLVFSCIEATFSPLLKW